MFEEVDDVILVFSKKNLTNQSGVSEHEKAEKKAKNDMKKAIRKFSLNNWCTIALDLAIILYLEVWHCLRDLKKNAF